MRIGLTKRGGLPNWRHVRHTAEAPKEQGFAICNNSTIIAPCFVALCQLSSGAVQEEYSKDKDFLKPVRNGEGEIAYFVL